MRASVRSRARSTLRAVPTLDARPRRPRRPSSRWRSRLSTLERWLAAAAATSWPGRSRCSMFAVASAALWLAGRGGWIGARRFRVFFLFGAILNVPWLALGTVYLLGRRRLGGRRAPPASSSCPASPPASWSRAAARRRCPPTSCPRAATCSAPLPRVLAAVGSGVAARRGHRRRAVVGVAAVARRRRRRAAAPTSRRAPRARQRAHRRRHARALGQRHARRPARRRNGVRGHARGGDRVLFVGFLVATPGACRRRHRADRPAASGRGALGCRSRACSAGRGAGSCRRGSAGSSSTNSTLVGHL